jgi:hypothetical protein
MIHRLGMTLIFVLLPVIFLIAGVGYAREHYVGFTDQQWIYDAMDLFSEQGYIRNYPKDWVKSGHELSRLEIANYIKQLLESKLKDDSENQQLPSKVMNMLQKMMNEFSEELTALGILATDIVKISPNLEVPTNKPDDYQDLDALLGHNAVSKTPAATPCYYFGQYYNSFQRKSFVFLPADYVNTNDFALLGGNVNNINIVYQPSLESKQLFLVVKGNLPLTDQRLVAGYFLFPIEDSLQGESLLSSGLDSSVLSLLDEVNHLQQVESIWRMEGPLSLKGYLKLDSGIQNKLCYGNIDEGLRIGSMLIYSDNPAVKPQYSLNRIGLPSYAPYQSAAVDLDTLKLDGPDSYQINITGQKNLNSHTSLYGGIDVFYQETNKKYLFEELMPPETKYSAGVNYQMNNEWKLLAYQSFVKSNSGQSQWKSQKLSTTSLSTTSFGVEYNDWVTLWLAYQMIDFEESVLTGLITFRF